MFLIDCLRRTGDAILLLILQAVSKFELEVAQFPIDFHSLEARQKVLVYSFRCVDYI